jgi:tRNA threonylcarbamoyladenosine biosynthesis protein TsaB
VITLAIDTCEPRGSVAIRRNGSLVSICKHEDGSDYSEWLLPSVDRVLAEGATSLDRVNLLAVATGPGSFTGLRVGLTTVKAWAEVYSTPLVGVSRLEAMARSVAAPKGYVAACYDAHRGQLFGGLFRVSLDACERVGDEFVSSPEEFVRFVEKEDRGESVAWITLDPQMIADLEPMKQRMVRGDKMRICAADLASAIGILGEEYAAKGLFSDPLALDANYVRRSDAEIFWKGPSANVR